ncbi:GAK system CofD-like protein [Pseudodesulfovibrio sp. JC047]|uniref:GAK system CofD-like protein n=1 Tax=Pseudodesulfovibrio sp. JC047 TaxID=2683199 RepID=UPI001EF228F6|nr:GAK system CofD-like protein [Pseudodesulfovibrio sp. JC047]
MGEHNAVERYRRSPELGPSLFFFSGGSALRETSQALAGLTYNSVHCITPFDSGGSSAVLREAFGIPAVGDIRNRLMALADQSVRGNNGVYALFTHRLSKQASRAELLVELERLASGEHFLMHCITTPVSGVIMEHLHHFLEIMPLDFDLRGASVGNLILTAGYLSHDREMGPVIDMFSTVATLRGLVRPVVDRDLHLVAELEDGTTVLGQHRMTGKEVSPLHAPIQSMWLTDSLETGTPVSPDVDAVIRGYLVTADLICYPPGSLYSSVIANLLPNGVGEAVCENPCPKVFVPSMGHDPEAAGLSVADQARQLLRYLAASGAPDNCRPLDCVVVDSRNGSYPSGVDIPALRDMGLTVEDHQLVTEKSAPYIDGQLLAELLVSLC